MAERVGFEPTEPFRAHRFSRPACSTTPAPLRAVGSANPSRFGPKPHAKDFVIIRIPMDNAIVLSNVSKAFGKFRAVDDLSLSVPRGAMFGLLGPNGAGKTTTIRMIMNITAPDTGEIRILGQPMDRQMQNRIGYLPEERGLYRKMKVIDHLYFLAAIK